MADSLHAPAMPDLSCSFCGKHWTEVRTLISGSAAFICDECISLCVEITAREGGLLADGRRRVRLARAARVDKQPLSAFLREHLAGRPAESVSLSELIDAYLARSAN